MSTNNICSLEKNDNKIDEIVEKIKYQSNNVSIDDWITSFDARYDEMKKISKSPDVVKFFDRWKLYVTKPVYVCLLCFSNILDNKILKFYSR